MNRTRLLIIGLLALVLGGFVSYTVYRTLQARATPGVRPGIEVVVAANDIQVGAKVEERDLKMVNYPAEELPPSVFRSKTKVVGRGVVLPVVKGEFLLPNKLAGENAGSGMPALIPPGMRAMSVRVNEVVSVAGFVGPGTRVDVLLTGNPAGSGEPQTTTVLENVAVLAAGQRLERNAAGEPQPTPVITLLVSPEDAQKLTLASSEGRIQLALRNPLDTGQEKLLAVRNASLYGVAPPAASAPKPRRLKRTPVLQQIPQKDNYIVQVIRGNKKEETTFDEK